MRICEIAVLAGLWGCSGSNGELLTGVPDANRGDVAAGRGVGAVCDILTDAGANMAVYNAEALECPSRICLKPAAQPGAPGGTNGGLCSTSCNQDSDCTGALADPTNPSDPRCRTGFVCGTPFVKGMLCCMKLCLCSDYLGSPGAQTPIACMGDAGANCEQP